METQQTAMNTIAMVGRREGGIGWQLRLDDNSIVFCPSDVCKVEPNAGERIVLRYLGNTFRVVGIRIGEPPRDYLIASQ